MKKNTRIPGFFKLSRKKKIDLVKDFADLTDKEVEIIEKGIFDPEIRDRIVENVIGTFPLPYSVAVNFLINKKNYLVPMVIEESSVVAAACHGARLTRESGGISAENLGNLMIGQIYLVDLKDAEKAKQNILENKQEILKIANQQKPDLVKIGGGVKDLEVKILKTKKTGSILRIHLLVDTKDAMGANTINTILEKTVPFIEKIVSGEAILKIISNLAEKRLVKVKAMVTKKSLTMKGFSGNEAVKRIVKVQEIAETDIYRAVTNNKGILNGMGAVVLATGNDWRALEAGAHGFAARTGKYLPLSTWKQNKQGDLIGEMTVPVTVGTVGGITKIHPLANISLKILKVESAQELARVIASVGLVQNLGAIRALALEGIQEGHMRLHAKNIAIAAGAKGRMIEKVADRMFKEKKIELKTAKEILKNI